MFGNSPYETVATGPDSSMVKLYLVTGVFTGVINVTVIFQWNDILFTIFKRSNFKFNYYLFKAS